VPDEHAGVDRDGRERIEVFRKAHFSERQPRRASAQIIRQKLSLPWQHRRDREAAMADDLGGDALSHFAFRLWIDRKDKVGMGLDVDEAGRHSEAACIDDLVGITGQGRAKRGNAAAFKRDVAEHAWAAAAIDKRAAMD